METTAKVLTNCILFKGLSIDTINLLLKNTNYKTSSFSKDQPIAIEGDECSSIGIVISGSIQIQKLFASGKVITITTLFPGQIFGEVIIFSNMHKYPSTINSCNNSNIIFIPKDQVLNLCSLNTTILNNFMGLLSNRILMLNNKVKNLSYHSIREKITSYILNEYSKQKNLSITLPCSKREIAEELGIPRPSLSRELINMKSEGLIDFNKNSLEILDITSLENLLNL